MLTFLIMLFTLLGVQQRSMEKDYKIPKLVVNLNEKETLELIDLIENSGNENLFIDLIADHVKSIYYDYETKSSTIVFKTSN